MAWQLQGRYFENCSCDMVCPCTTSGLTMPADYERCRVVLVFHVDLGTVEDVDVSGLTVAVLADTPPLMADGNWRVGVFMDAAASQEQAEKLGAVFAGQLGGPMAMLAPLISEMLGVQSAPIEYVEDGRRHRVKIGDEVDITVEDFVPPQTPEGPVEQLVGMFHPANSTLTIARATASRVNAFGLQFDNTGKNGHSAPFSWGGMTTSAAPSLRHLTPQAAVLLLAAAVAWLVTVGRAGTMVGMTGTMGLSLPAFVGMWSLMMAAMMLPSVAPVASMYQRSVRSYRALRLAGFTGGYLLAWAGAGIPAFLLTAFVARLVNGHPGWATAVAVVVFASCGVYQLTSLKSRCLKHCRSPLSLLLHYGAYRGRLRDVRAGAHHGAWCLGCCWSLMALFVVVGVMNLAAMVVLAAVVLAEKLWVHGEVLARVVGVAALALAVAVIWVPALAPGLHSTSQMMDMAGP